MTIKELITQLETFQPDLLVMVKTGDDHKLIEAVEGNNLDGCVDLLTPSAMPLGICQCADPECPHCSGDCVEMATERLFRVDQTDLTGIPMCFFCSEDALNSGVFSTSESKP